MRCGECGVKSEGVRGAARRVRGLRGVRGVRGVERRVRGLRGERGAQGTWRLRAVCGAGVRCRGAVVGAECAARRGAGSVRCGLCGVSSPGAGGAAAAPWNSAPSGTKAAEQCGVSERG